MNANQEARPNRRASPHLGHLPRQARLRKLIALGVLAALLAVSCSKDSRTRGITPTAPNPEPIYTGFPPVYPEHQRGASWSRTGLIAYRDEGITCVFRSGAYLTSAALAGIWVFDPASGSRNRILPYGEDPSWSPDGSKLAFEYGAQIYVMDAGGTGVRQLTFGGLNFYPTWHPSGISVYFDSNGGSSSLFFSPWAINVDGSGLHRVCWPGGQAGARFPSWRPDSSALALVSSQGGEYVLSILNDSCSVRTAAGGFPYCESPEYSPSGDRIAFCASSSAQPYPTEIWVCNADGSDLHQVTRRGGAWPAWSPDGRAIAYTARNQDDSSSIQGTIHILNLITLTDSVAVHVWPPVCP